MAALLTSLEMSLLNFNSLRTTIGLDVLKYAQARQKGTASFIVALDSRFYKKSKEGDWNEIKPIDKHTERIIFSCYVSEAIAISSAQIASLFVPAYTSPRPRAAASPITDELVLRMSLSLSATV